MTGSNGQLKFVGEVTQVWFGYTATISYIRVTVLDKIFDVTTLSLLVHRSNLTYITNHCWDM